MAVKSGVVRNLLLVASDPSAGGGTPSPLYTIAEDTSTGFLWAKTGAADTAWTVVASGGSSTPVVASYSANNTIASNVDIVFVDSSGGAFNLTFSNPAAQTKQKLLIVDVGGSLNTNNVTLVRFAAEKIAGLAASKLLQTDWGTYNVTTNLTDWFL
jgi:predicted flavoprotein YhiN